MLIMLILYPFYPLPQIVNMATNRNGVPVSEGVIQWHRVTKVRMTVVKHVIT